MFVLRISFVAVIYHLFCHCLRGTNYKTDSLAAVQTYILKDGSYSVCFSIISFFGVNTADS